MLFSEQYPSMSSTKTEFLALLLPNLLLIIVYHPFWSEVSEHHSAISCMTDIIDYALSKSPQQTRVVICGDFNGLRHYYDEISRVTCTRSL